MEEIASRFRASVAHATPGPRLSRLLLSSYPICHERLCATSRALSATDVPAHRSDEASMTAAEETGFSAADGARRSSLALEFVQSSDCGLREHPHR